MAVGVAGAADAAAGVAGVHAPSSVEEAAALPAQMRVAGNEALPLHLDALMTVARGVLKGRVLHRGRGGAGVHRAQEVRWRCKFRQRWTVRDEYALSVRANTQVRGSYLSGRGLAEEVDG